MSKKDKIITFWEWFLKHEHMFYFGLDKEYEREALYDELSDIIGEINDSIVFTFSPTREDNTKTFCLSADGIKQAFDDVKSLIDSAPEHEHWVFVAFRQRLPGDDLSIQMGDAEIGYNDIYFRYVDKEELGVELNVKDFNENGVQQNAIFILLDALLGEQDVVEEIDWIDWVMLDENNKDNLFPFVQLRTIVDARKNRKIQ